jgi:hypothetical protein
VAGEGIRAELHQVRVHMASAPIGCAAARPIDFRDLGYCAEECECGPSRIGETNQLDLGE